MKRSLQNVGLLLYLLLVVKITKSEDNVLYRLVRAVHGRTQNASLYNTDPSWYNNKQQPNATRSQWTNPGGQYTQGYNPNYPPPGGNNSGGQYNQGYNQNYPPPGGNNPGGRYAQGYLVNQNYPQPGGRTQNQYGQNADPYGYYSKQPSWNGTASQSNNPGGNYQGNNQGNVGWNLPAGSSSYPSGNQQYRPSSYSSTSPPWDNHGNSHNYPSHAGGRPQNTTWNSPNFNGYNSNPLGTWNSTNPQRNYQYAGPNDLMIHSYRRKRAANNYYYSSRPSYSRNNYREFRNCSSTQECYNNYYNDYYNNYHKAKNNYERYQNNQWYYGQYYRRNGNDRARSMERVPSQYDYRYRYYNRNSHYQDIQQNTNTSLYNKQSRPPRPQSSPFSSQSGIQSRSPKPQFELQSRSPRPQFGLHSRLPRPQSGLQYRPSRPQYVTPIQNSMLPRQHTGNIDIFSSIETDSLVPKIYIAPSHTAVNEPDSVINNFEGSGSDESITEIGGDSGNTKVEDYDSNGANAGDLISGEISDFN